MRAVTAALRANAQAWEEQAKAQAYQEYMSGVMEQYNAVMEEAAANEMELTKAQIQAEDAAKEWTSLTRPSSRLWG